jgi:hypothetical protein
MDGPIHNEFAAEPARGNLQIVLRSRIITGLFGRGPEYGERAPGILQTRCNLLC